MTEEEKKAIEYFKNNLEMTKEMGKRWGFQEEIKNNEIILNLIEKQEKVIDLMAEDIYENDNFYKLKCAFEKVEKGKEKEYIKERFYKGGIKR